ncbi:MAG: M16 family metallopeptidase [Chloroflexota bacterium]
MLQTTQLPSGPLVVSEAVPGFGSVSIGAWVGVGSAHEPAARSGLSHFIEHLVFKGTRRRTARELAEAIEDVGGQINAYTAKDYSCFYAKVRQPDIGIAVDVLGDMLTESTFTPDDVDRERGVVLDEIRLAEDDPGDVVHDLFCSTCWPTSPLGRPVSGTRLTVSAISQSEVVNFFRSHYGLGNLVVVAAGAVDHEQLIELVERHFLGATAPAPAVLLDIPQPCFSPDFAYRARATEQVHLCLGSEALAIDDPDVYTLEVANVLIGGGASSRLFQEVREERGLAYDIYSYPSFHRRAGLFTVYAAASPDLAVEVAEIAIAELRSLIATPPTEREVARARAQLLASLTFGLESSGSRAARIGKSQFYLGRVETIEEAGDLIARVTPADIQRLAGRLFSGRFAVAAVGAGEAEQPLADLFRRIG